MAVIKRLFTDFVFMKQEALHSGNVNPRHQRTNTIMK